MFGNAFSPFAAKAFDQTPLEVLDARTCRFAERRNPLRHGTAGLELDLEAAMTIAEAEAHAALGRDHVLTGDARIEKLEVRAMQARAVIGVVAVLDQLPVARRIHLLAAGDDLETVLGLIGHEVEKLGGTGWVLLQRNGLGVVVYEVEVAVGLEPRHARQIVAAIGIEALGVAALGALVTELPGLRIVDPAMVRTRTRAHCPTVPDTPSNHGVRRR